jgi:hypothetical protein
MTMAITMTMGITMCQNIGVNSALVCTQREREDGKQTVSDREGEGSSLPSSTKPLV